MPKRSVLIGLTLFLSSTVKAGSLLTTCDLASGADRAVEVIRTKEDHDAATAFCQDVYRARAGTAGLSQRAFVIRCLRKIGAGIDPTL